MPVKFANAATPDERDDDTNASAQPLTIIGLFEDDIDTRKALLRLRKHDMPAAAVSLLIRLGEADDEALSNGQGAVARAIAATGLESVAEWLLGFVSVVAQGRGLFLVAGPVGAALAGEHVTSDAGGDEQSAISAVLTHFGFNRDEAAYMDSRLQSGSLLISVTSSERDLLHRASQTFSNENAVYIPTTATEPHVAELAARLLVSPPEQSTDGDVVVTDAVARFFRLCDSRRANLAHVAMLDQRVVDPDGQDVGEIVDFIAETLVEGNEAQECDEVRYAIVAFGGILGVGKHHAAIPIDRFDLDADPISVSVTRDILRDAPPYNRVAPFSRQEEHSVCSYFGATPYWSDMMPVAEGADVPGGEDNAGQRLT